MPAFSSLKTAAMTTAFILLVLFLVTKFAPDSLKSEVGLKVGP